MKTIQIKILECYDQKQIVTFLALLSANYCVCLDH